jgi:hypothetical protein
MSRFMAGHELERMDTSMLAEGLTRLGIPLQDFPAVVDCMPRRSDSGAVMDHRVDSTGGSDPPGNFEGVAKSPLPSYLP